MDKSSGVSMTAKNHIVTVLACASLAQVCTGQCRTRWWSFGRDHNAKAMTIWDVDGPGPGRAELIAGIHSAPVIGVGYPRQVMRFDGRTWRPIGEILWGFTGLDAIHALEVAQTSGVGSPVPGSMSRASSRKRAGSRPRASCAGMARVGGRSEGP